METKIQNCFLFKDVCALLLLNIFLILPVNQFIRHEYT